MKKVIIFLATGFEEIEAITPIDILRRGGCEVVLAGLHSEMVTGAHGITLKVDTVIADIKIENYDLLILPGGLPGAINLAESNKVCQDIRAMLETRRKVAAICAAPWILEASQVLNGRKFTCYPGCENKINSGEFTGHDVEVDGQLITSRGVGTALAFSFQLLEELGLTEEMITLRKATLMDKREN